MAGRKIGLYFAWSRVDENEAPLGVLENRYPSLFEFRRATWPHFETLKKSESYRQDIAGFLDHIIKSDFDHFRKVVHQAAGHPVTIIERAGGTPPVQQLDKDFLAAYNTLIIVSLDHFRTNQSATTAEIEAIRDFLSREDRCVFICPHHDIGVTDDRLGEAEILKAQKIQFDHHRDGTIPGQQQIGGFARSVMNGLGMAVRNRWGLNPSKEADGRPTPLRITADMDDAGLLKGVTTFNLHPHLPHLEFASDIAGQVDVLARQVINPAAAPHPFVQAGNTDFNALLRLRSPNLPGRIYVGDATLWSAAFGGLDSLTQLWRNIATMRLP